jgi:hypothetical protein
MLPQYEGGELAGRQLSPEQAAAAAMVAGARQRGLELTGDGRDSRHAQLPAVLNCCNMLT